MSMLLIRGTFRATGSKPDGDTIPFTPDNVADWKRVPGDHQVLPKADGHASIRLEAIDALETHYGDDESGVQHQPLDLAHRAADELLTWLGFTQFVRDDRETITSTTPETVPGFILTGGADIFGRCVALVGRRIPPAFNGYEIEVDERQLRNTANHHLVSLGLAYPTFYTGFPEPLRASLTLAAQAAKSSTPKKGVWDRDRTTDGAEVTGMSSLTADTGAVILPKLFRRLKDYLDLAPAAPTLGCFRAYLAGAADRFYLQGQPEPLTGLHHIVEIDAAGQTLKMTHPVEDITFDEK
ncbi:nuclease [Streptomyces sp. NPDC004667]|uniref:nuclease n=1 Tax=Streptomyces sp. NPDC004667 TaxID=3154285 RepID=UPI0033BE3005